MRPPIHFDGAPDLVARMKALMPTEQTARVIYAKADPRKVGLLHSTHLSLQQAAEQFRRIYGIGIRVIRRAA